MEKLNELLEGIRQITGDETMKNYSDPDKNFEVWVTEPDAIGSYVMVDRSGNVSVYGKTKENQDKIYLSVDSLVDFKKDYKAVRMMIMIENHPDLVEDKKICSGRDLLMWIEENDLLLRLDPDEAAIVMETYLETGYGLYFDDDGGMYMDKCGRAVKVCVDDVIDLAGERSYEKIANLKEELANTPADRDSKQTGEDFSKHLDKFSELMHLEMRNKSIISAYSKTVYGKRYYYNYQYVAAKNESPRKARKL